ncbi:MAG: LLM class flavin-dependent oxidoreductase [Acidimicrobiia bacterium]|nr:LLM class flavin-dependent oxidoreductase [Acidimicrobiia bacterium]
MKFGFVLPYGDAATAADLARIAEDSGWDGFFVWEPVWGIDAWVCLTAAAMTTSTIRLGTMLTPASRMRPWKLASEAATLDNLSGGRVILAVGLGAIDTGFAEFGEETDRRTRAELLDESLEIVTGLWAGQPFGYEGKHYMVKPLAGMPPPPPPVQRPRIPIWVVGAWGHPKSMERALKYDGILAQVKKGEEFPAVTPEVVAAVRHHAAEHRDTPIDLIVEGSTGGDPAADSAKLESLAAAGATWWIEGMWDAQNDLVRVRERVLEGPLAAT